MSHESYSDLPVPESAESENDPRLEAQVEYNEATEARMLIAHFATKYPEVNDMTVGQFENFLKERAEVDALVMLGGKPS